MVEGGAGRGDREEETEEESRVPVVSAFKKQLQAKGNRQYWVPWGIYCCCHGRVQRGEEGLFLGQTHYCCHGRAQVGGGAEGLRNAGGVVRGAQVESAVGERKEQEWGRLAGWGGEPVCRRREKD